jgi:UDP-N-acetylglucosamine 2-epimerase (non-hydrolysing)
MIEHIIDLVAGARPNFMKLAPVMKATLAQNGLRPRIVHTGQHYDYGMNGVFFEELGIPEPDVHLEVGSGSHAVQTARILEGYEAHLMKNRPAATVVFGDVNSTIACALAAVKLGVPVVHVEAGLRSFDRTMPEEINRILTDAIAELLLVSEPSGMGNLTREGIERSKAKLVGNVMIDTLKREYNFAKHSRVLEKLDLNKREYILMTLHRPANVDDPRTLRALLEVIIELSQKIPVVFPVHPRTRHAAEQAGLTDILLQTKSLRYVNPLAYRDNLWLMANARMVLTDSGGMQEETTYLKVPCLTLRENTERPITVEKGTSRLVGNDPKRIREAFEDVLGDRWPVGEDIPLWDGHAGKRVAEKLSEWLEGVI